MRNIATETITPKRLAGLMVKPVQERAPYLNMLIYGDSGVGKTTLAGSADAVPSMRPVLFVDIEGGTESLRHSYPNVDQVRVRNWKEMQALYDELYGMKHGYQTVVLDSLTEIQKFNMYDIMQGVVEKDPARDEDIASIREWGKNLEQTRKFVRAFRDLPVHTIFTALVLYDRNQRTGVTTLRPQLSGKAAGEVAAFLDIVVYYYMKEVVTNGETEQKRLLLTQKTEEVTAKDRSGKLPVVIEAPTMAEMFKIMYPRTQTNGTPIKEKVNNG